MRPFTQENVKSVPEVPGIYAIIDAEFPTLTAYVGRSDNLRQRLLQHVKGQSHGTIAMLVRQNHDLLFSCQTSTARLSRAQEAAEILRLEPVGNRRMEWKSLEDF